MDSELYEDNELISIIQSVFDLSVSKSDLETMKPDFVKRIYSLILKDFGFNVDGLGQFPIDAPDMVSSHPEMYRNAYFTFSLSKMIRQTLYLIYNDNSFSPKDLFSPDPNRTKYFFTNLFTFYETINENMPIFDEAKMKVQMKIEKRDKMVEAIKRLNAKRCEMKLRHGEEQIFMLELQESITAISKKIIEVQEEIAEIKTQINTCQRERDDLVNDKNSLELKVLEARDNTKKLLSQVICEEDKEEVEEMEGQLNALKIEVNETKEKEKSAKHNLKNMELAEEIVSSFEEVLKGIEETAVKYQGLTKEDNDLQAKIVKLTEEKDNLSSNIKSLQEKLNMEQGNKGQILRKKAKKTKESEEEIKKLQNVLKNLKETNEKNENLGNSLEEEFQSILKEKQNTQKKLESMKKCYSECMELINIEIQNQMSGDLLLFEQLQNKME